MREDQDVQFLREAVAQRRVLWHHHALARLLERGISRAEVLQAIAYGDVIERYPGRAPLPCYLMLRAEPEPVHVVAALDRTSGTCHVVTVYRPDLEHFEADFRTRRKRS